MRVFKFFFLNFAKRNIIILSIYLYVCVRTVNNVYKVIRKLILNNTLNSFCFHMQNAGC